MRIRSVILIAILAMAVPLIAAEPADSPNAAAGPCSLTGTWYGGSDPIYPFAWTLTPAGGNRYTSNTAQGTDFRFLGYTSWTDWNGEATPISPRSWDSWGVAFWLWDPAAAAAAGVDGSLPEMDVVHARIDLIDCDTFVSTIDVYAAYFAWTVDRTPFVDPYDLSFLPPGGTLVETYHRLPRWTDGLRTKTLTLPRTIDSSPAIPKKR